MPTITVFLMFGPKDRNGRGNTKEDGPDWKAIKAEVAKSGYTLNVDTHLPFIPTVSQIQDALSNSEVVLFVGHGASAPGAHGTKFVSAQMQFTDGMIKSPDGYLIGQWTAAKDRLDHAKNAGKPQLNKVAGLFTCNSTDEMPNAFDLAPGSHLITNDGGKDGLTRIGTLEWGAAAFVRSYARTKGDVRKSMASAQAVFADKGTEWAPDEGDKLSDKVGVSPPSQSPSPQPSYSPIGMGNFRRGLIPP
jgi:hypothetical protein